MANPKLITYASKRLPEAVRILFHYRVRTAYISFQYSIVFPTYLKRVDFDAISRSSMPLTHIIKSKAEPATIKIKRLLELISSYSFNLYYIKGKDIVSK